jgi:hypothetical protein
VRKNCSRDREKLLKFVAEGREFAKFLKSLKVSRSRNKICRAETSPKNERTNLFFYPDDSEILET